MAKADKRIVQREIEHEGSSIKVPVGMSYNEAIDNLVRMRDYEDTTVAIEETVEGFPLDVAIAFQRVLKRRYGWAQARGQMTMWGENPPHLISVETGLGTTEQVPWGRFTIAGIDGRIQTGMTRKNRRFVFQLQAVVKRKHENAIRDIAAETRVEVRENSIYRGKALKLTFEDESTWAGETHTPELRFMDVSQPVELVYSEHVQNAIDTNLLTPLRNQRILSRYGLPFKRGVLLAGVYGTGKTLAMHTAAQVATQNGITFVHVERADNFAEAVEFARMYAPAVVSCEDIDRVTDGVRDANMDSILNVVDGIDSKHAEVMVVLTTNNVQAIHQGMLRPGRLDAVIEVEPPDAGAVERLIRLYGRGLVAEDVDLTRVGALLSGQIPAVVREVVERAKLAALRLASFNDQGELLVTEDALVDSAQTMRMQISLLNRKPEASPNEMELFGRAFATETSKGLSQLAHSLVHGHPVAMYTSEGRDAYIHRLPDGAVAALASSNNSER